MLITQIPLLLVPHFMQVQLYLSSLTYNHCIVQTASPSSVLATIHFLTRSFSHSPTPPPPSLSFDHSLTLPPSSLSPSLLLSLPPPPLSYSPSCLPLSLIRPLSYSLPCLPLSLIRPLSYSSPASPLFPSLAHSLTLPLSSPSLKPLLLFCALFSLAIPLFKKA